MVPGTLPSEGTPFRVERSRSPIAGGLVSVVMEKDAESFIAPRSIVRPMRETPAGAFLLPGPVKRHPRVLHRMPAPAMNTGGPESTEILSEFRNLPQSRS